MLEGRDLNDTQILESTIQEQNEEKPGTVRFRTTLPSGRELTSEWMDPDDAKRVVIQWCDNVRQQADIDIKEKEAVRLREQGGFDVSSVEEKSAQADAEETPLEYATRMRDAYQKRVNVIETRIIDLKSERKTIRKHLEDWEKVVNTLRGEA